MKHTHLGRSLSAALVTAVVAALAVGCQASASMQAGGGTTPTSTPATPPPTTPPAATPAPTPEPAKPAGQPIKGDMKGSRVQIPGNVVYDTGKATIKEDLSGPTLNQLKQFLTDNPQVTKLRIEGHTDSDGDDAMNMKLSGQRALSVVAWLVGKGIARDRLIAVAFGETKPIAPNDTPANKEQNRRTEFHVAQIDNKNFLGRDPNGGGEVVNGP